ncbi:MAG: hypothetical protein GEU93_02590 [Propionibacteriales bacterium]|nr:hypothetical protein [Propionibacteriales bacterium]
MSRALWFAVGMGSGVYVVVKTRRVVERFTPAGISYQVGALRLGAREFSREVREGMAERENQLRDQLWEHHNAVQDGHTGRSAIGPAEHPPEIESGSRPVPAAVEYAAG